MALADCGLKDLGYVGDKYTDTAILHHVFLLLFIMFLSIIMLFGVILLPFLS